MNNPTTTAREPRTPFAKQLFIIVCTSMILYYNHNDHRDMAKRIGALEAREQHQAHVNEKLSDALHRIIEILGKL